MRVRITDPISKAAYLVVAIAVVFIVAATAAIGLGASPAALLASALVAILVCVGARTFRGPGEPVAPPRAWWRMTARPLAGFAGAAAFLASAVGAATGSGSGSVAAVVIVFDVVVAAAYLNSSLRLVRELR